VRRVRKRAIWVNIPFGGVAFTESAGTQLLVVGEDWEAQFSGLANERAVLRAIVGQITIQGTTGGTNGTTGFFGIYIRDNDLAATPPVFTTTGMSEVDWLHVGAFGTTGTVVGQTMASLAHRDVRVKAKRRLQSKDSISIVAQYGADAASPAGVLGGLLRFLIARD